MWQSDTVDVFVARLVVDIIHNIFSELTYGDCPYIDLSEAQLSVLYSVGTDSPQ